MKTSSRSYTMTARLWLAEETFHAPQGGGCADSGRSLRAALTTEAGLNALLSLEVDGSSHLTMAREIQRHPVRGTVLHVDFQIVRRDEVMSADVTVNLVGEAEDVQRRDGLVEQSLHSLTVNATPDRMSEAYATYLGRDFDLSLELPGAVTRSNATSTAGRTVSWKWPIAELSHHRQMVINASYRPAS